MAIVFSFVVSDFFFIVFKGLWGSLFSLVSTKFVCYCQPTNVLKNDDLFCEFIGLSNWSSYVVKKIWFFYFTTVLTFFSLFTCLFQVGDSRKKWWIVLKKIYGRMAFDDDHGDSHWLYYRMICPKSIENNKLK